MILTRLVAPLVSHCCLKVVVDVDCVWCTSAVPLLSCGMLIQLKHISLCHDIQ